MMTSLQPAFSQEITCPSRNREVIDQCVSTCNDGLFYSFNNPIPFCKNTKGDGIRLHAYRAYEPMPSIRFSYNVNGVLDCDVEHAGRIGIMPPFTETNIPWPELYPVSFGRFNEADVFLVSTCEAKDLLFSTNNPNARIKFLTTQELNTQLERMTILNNGNVGIGTATPEFDVHIVNQLALGTKFPGGTYRPEERGILTLLPGYTSNNWYHLDTRDNCLNFSAGGLAGGSGGPIGCQDIMSLYNTGSQVRIGCTFATGWTPAIGGKLTISEDPTTNTGFRSPIMMRIERRNDATYAATTPYKLISAGDNTKETFVVKSNGKVEIGNGTNGTAGRRIPVSPDDDYLLSVDGKVVGREMIVTATTEWSDYVFSDDYNLPTLEEVELQIRSKKHLADVPSAADVEKSGINLGEMQAVLLKKIEELTLYMIKMNKENTALQAEVAALKSLISPTK